MTGAGWFLVIYLGFAAWGSTAVLIHKNMKRRGYRSRAATAITALVIMWAIPAIYAQSFFSSGGKKK